MTRPAEDAPDRGVGFTRAVVVVGCGLFVLVDAALIAGAGLPVLDAMLLSVLLVAFPALSLAQLPFLRELSLERMAAYKSSIVHLLVMGTTAALVGARVQGAAGVGLRPMPWSELIPWSIGLTASVLGAIVLFHVLSRMTGLRDSPVLRQLLPVTASEKGVFALLSVAAGFGEEIAFRGYAIPLLAPLLGVPGAVLLTSFLFGLAHAYQGLLGILRTGVMGAVLAAGFLASGSLWPAIAAHVALDLIAGIAIGDRLLSPEAESGVGQEALDKTPGH